MSVLTIKDLHVSVETDQGTKRILNGVDLTVNEGEIHAIMGQLVRQGVAILMISSETN